MSPGRILHCIPTMGGGGAERQLAYLAAALVRRGWDVHVALAAGGPNMARLEAGGSVIHRLRARGNYDPGIIWRLARTIDRVQPDVVQVWMIQMEVVGALAARYMHVPWILSERCSEAAYTQSLKYRLREWIAPGASAVVSNSSGGYDYWDRRLGAQVARYVIPNALPLDEIRATEPADAARTRISASEPVILFAGRLTEQKNPETLMKALVSVLARPGTRAVFAGEGPLRHTLEALSRGYGIEPRVRFTGYVADLWAWMKRASVFVSPSRYEGHPNTVLEAAACGCPLVVSDIPAHLEFLDEHRARLVPADDAAQLARGIIDVLDHPDAARTRADGAARMVEQWSPAAIAQEYERVYLDVIDRTPGSEVGGR